MKIQSILLVSVGVLVSTQVLAESNTNTKHIRVHDQTDTNKTPTSVIRGLLSTLIPIGHQCAYDPKLVSSLYPCANDGVCVRTNATYGQCFTKEEATKLQVNGTSTEDEEDDEEEDDDEEDNAVATDASKVPSSGSKGTTVGENEEEEGDDEDDEEEEEEEDNSTR